MTRREGEGRNAVDDEPEDAEGEEAVPGDMPAQPPCPFCDGRRTELMNAFGPHASVASYWCRTCRSPFEFMKWGRRADDRPGGPSDSRS